MPNNLPDNYQLELLQKMGVDRFYKLPPPTDTLWINFINRLLKSGWTEREIDESMFEMMADIYISKHPELLIEN